MSREIVREWRGTRRLRVEVLVQHPQYGPVPRGWIEALPTTDWCGHWQVTDNDRDPIDASPVVGDYLTAEAALLAATKELDEEENR